MNLTLTPHPDRRIRDEATVRWDRQMIGYCFTTPRVDPPQYLRFIVRVSKQQADEILTWVNRETGVEHCGITMPPEPPVFVAEETALPDVTMVFDDEGDDGGE